MGELHCPARFLICADPSTPEATAALARERVALRVDDPPTDAVGIATLLDELTDRYRGECVVMVLPSQTLAGLGPEITASTADRDITVVTHRHGPPT